MAQLTATYVGHGTHDKQLGRPHPPHGAIVYQLAFLSHCAIVALTPRSLTNKGFTWYAVVNASRFPAGCRCRLFERNMFPYRRLKEEAFAVLFFELPSRPNVPVNVLVSLNTLKVGYSITR